jgi:hypothetical protein
MTTPKGEPQRPSADAWAVIIERGYSEAWIAKIENLEELKFWNPALQRWLASDSDLGIVTAPMRKGEINVRTAYIATREDLAEAIQQITNYLASYIGNGKRIAWAQGGSLSGETQKIIRETLGTLPGPWAFN